MGEERGREGSGREIFTALNFYIAEVSTILDVFENEVFLFISCDPQVCLRVSAFHAPLLRSR